MNRTVELVLTALALAGMYCAIPKNVAQSSTNPVVRAEQVIIADGSDPMPLCRGRHCANR
jgi:hypothetical protein